MDFEAWFSSEPAPAPAPSCPSHGLELDRACARCGGFCCEACTDATERSLCERCGALAARQRQRDESRGIAWKLALAPALVTASAVSLAWRHRPVPEELAAFLVPLACALLVARTRQPLFAWLGALVSVGLLAWAAAVLVGAEQWSRLGDVALLTVAPLVALPGCVRLTRAHGLRALREAALT